MPVILTSPDSWHVPVKILTFLASSFAWRPHSRTLSDGASEPPPQRVGDAVVVFFQAEQDDEDPDRRKRALRHALKHIKWLANKRGYRNIVLHSFGHLGSSKASSEFARAFQDEVAERLGSTYEVACTPFGWSCSWDLSVEGDTLAKVWKEI
ncbi:MAG TPA: hypothetical protein ENJ09_04995 [Planctomycetes bacterium]|nr:hypothetical protein [Planctomycetota bacterium]